MRNHLRVVHGREHGAEQGDSGDRGDESSAAEKNVIDRITQANAGHVHVHQGVRAATMPMSEKSNLLKTLALYGCKLTA